MRTFRDFSPALIRLRFNKSIPKVEIFLHHRREIIHNYYNHLFLEIFQMDNRYQFFWFRKTTVRSLPKPYRTDCFDYHTIGYTSLRDCVAKCRKKALSKALGKWLGNLLTEDKNENLHMVEIFEVFSHNQSLDTKIGDQCKEECHTKNECVIQYFWLKNHSFPYKQKSFQVLAFTSDEPDLSYDHSPKMVFEEFISFLGSIISLWFGFNVIRLSDMFSMLSQRVIRFIKRDVKNNLLIIKPITTINYNKRMVHLHR